MKKLLNIKKIHIAMVVIILIVLMITLVLIKVRRPKEETVETYSYNNVAEQVLADEVIVYLHDTAGFGDGISKKTGNEAVETYRSIVRSDVDVVNDDHTQAIQERIGSALKEFAAEEDMTLSAGDITSLSAGVTELIWQSVLNQIEIVTENVETSEYFYLAESLQQQIDELEERKTKVSIKANINNKEADLSAEELIKLVHGMTDNELEEFAKSLGISLDDLKEEMQKDILKEEMQKDILKEVESKYGNIKDGKDGAAGATGKAGKDGKDGAAGATGKAGKDGKDGLDGKTTYIAYADDKSGTGFSLEPTETTKYVGSCITTKREQPTDYKEYSNWQEYRAYIITVTTDENDVTTVHIN